MVSHKHKFIFLHIPKCAGTSIGETLNSYFDEYWNYSGFKIHHDDLTKKMLKEYFVFSIVRNPWDRLFSQYKFRPWLNCDPFEDTAYNLEEKFESAYNKSVRNIPEHINPKLDNAFNRANWFDEFVHIPSQVEFLNGKYNDNMKKISYIDYIGRFEDLDNSWKYICEKLNIPEITLPHKNVSEGEKDYKKIYTDETKAYVAEKYSDDIKLFNYEF